VIAAFTFIAVFSDTVKAPDETTAREAVVSETPEPEEINDEPDDEAEDELPDEPEPPDEPDVEEIKYDPAADGFIPLIMDASDIHRGELLLVNQDNSFSIPDDLDLVNIIETRTVSFRVQQDGALLSRIIMTPLDEMMDAFISATGVRTVEIISAFRTLDHQQRILNNYISRMGRREALRWAALPGHSEHHTGLALDFGILSGGVRSTFTGTDSTSWFRRNSHKFGFILRFPPNKIHITQTAHEPWHFRYVGLPHSTIMFQNNLCLEEYIDFLREYTFEEPFEFEHEGKTYIIYFAAAGDVKLPLNSEFEISGNNVDGFIVTVIMLEHDPSAVVELSV